MTGGETFLSPSFAIAQQPPRQRGPWVGIIHTPMSSSTILLWGMVYSLRTCWMLRHRVRNAHPVDIDPLRDLRYALCARYVRCTRYALRARGIYIISNREAVYRICHKVNISILRSKNIDKMRNPIDFYKVPIGFGLALSANTAPC